MAENLFAPAPAPKTALGRYRVLGPNCGLRVSPLQLGGHVDRHGMERDDGVHVEGGNDESEEWIGEWMASRNVRDRVIIATKYTTDYKLHSLGKNEAILFGGNHKRSLHMSEMMDSLHILLEQGKVLYLGVSGRWNVMLRDFEREIIPMARQFGLALAPWDAIGSGRLLSKKQLEARLASGEKMRGQGGNVQTELERKYSEVLEEVGKEHNVDSVTAVALAYVMAKTPYVFPLVGGRKISHLHDNIRSLEIKLTPDP
ncbi:hypothetical protein C6P46_000869 [Rhodotorula mucilaginosa]|uniref:NADP-dependent oxidoreductase domain-containing protein n=1 Tax=Rhodotorula mucilaginosa TaxID=5537 RepID=A0A9P6VTQ1_RHOMI|nr:hypothetical protein C6P46_000869 [Rhodotorula mucilaginosa]TKA50524.1 hypothetical protein B0A53_06102 [Rhodotorula sp. CCFEE 5036]